MSDAPRLRQLRPRDLDPTQREMYDAIVGGPHKDREGLLDSEGRLGGPLNTYLHAPAAGTAQAAFGAALSYELVLPRRTAEIAILTVLHRAEAGFAIAAHEWAGYQNGLTHAQLDALRERREPRLDDPVDRAAWLATGLLLTSGDLSDDEYDKAVGALGERGLVELTMLIGYYQLLARQLRVFRIARDAYRGPQLPARS